MESSLITSIQAINKIQELKQSKEWNHLSPAIKQKQNNKLNYHYAVIGRECGLVKEVMLKVATAVSELFTKIAIMFNDFAMAFNDWVNNL